MSTTEVDGESEYQLEVKEILESYGEPGAKLSRCPDQYVGQISAFTSDKDFKLRRPAKCRPKDLGCLILILESPHKDEFIGDFGPAKGQTGLNIVRHLVTIKGFAEYEALGLILVNAVQYQCSLGKPTVDYRDTIFDRIWKAGGREDFSTRLKKLHRPGDVVVVSCTKGNLRGGREKHLRTMVHDGVRESLREKNAVVLRRTHPSSWYAKNNRDSEWPVAELNNEV